MIPDKKVVWLVEDNYFKFTKDSKEWRLPVIYGRGWIKFTIASKMREFYALVSPVSFSYGSVIGLPSGWERRLQCLSE